MNAYVECQFSCLQQEEAEQGIFDWKILQAEDGSGRYREKVLGMLKFGLLLAKSATIHKTSARDFAVHNMKMLKLF